MGLFSNRVSERKWPDTFPSIGRQMRDDATRQLRALIQSPSMTGFGMIDPPSPEAIRQVHLLQMMVFCTTIQELGYVRPADTPNSP